MYVLVLTLHFNMSQAGGSVGSHIAHALLATGQHTVTALTRTSSTTVLPKGVIPFPVDYSSPASLVSALKDQKIQVLVITLSVQASEDTHRMLVAAAAEAGVPYVMPNCYSVVIPDEVLRKESLAGELAMGYIRDVQSLTSTTSTSTSTFSEWGSPAWIALACSFWYEYSLSGGYLKTPLDLFGFDFHSRKAVFFDDGTAKINTSTWEQCGRAVASLLSLKEFPEDAADDREEVLTVSSWRNRPLRISSFYISQRDMLDSIHRVMGTTDADWEIVHENSAERYKAAVETMKTGDRAAFGRAMYTRIFFADANRPGQHYASVEGIFNEQLGLPVEDLDEATRRAIDMVVPPVKY